MRSDFARRLLEPTPPDAIFALSPDGKVLHWNRAAETMFASTNEQDGVK